MFPGHFSYFNHDVEHCCQGKVILQLDAALRFQSELTCLSSAAACYLLLCCNQIQTSSTGGAGCTSHVIAKQELTLEVAVNGIAAKFVSACHAAADLAVEPTMNKELSLSWRLYMTEQDCTNKDKVIATLQVGDVQQSNQQLCLWHTFMSSMSDSPASNVCMWLGCTTCHRSIFPATISIILKGTGRACTHGTLLPRIIPLIKTQARRFPGPFIMFTNIFMAP